MGGAAAAVELGVGLPPLRPVGALALAALGLALMHPGKDSRVAFAVGLAVTALAAFGVALALFNRRACPCHRALAGPVGCGAPVLGPALIRVAVAGALASGLAGGSLALSRFGRYRFAATMLGSVAGTTEPAQPDAGADIGTMTIEAVQAELQRYKPGTTKSGAKISP